MLNKTQIDRIVEIITIAEELGWENNPKPQGCYPLMQRSEVEKCTIAMIDDFELKRMRKWYKDSIKVKIKAKP